MRIPPWLLRAVIIVVVAAWATNFVAQLLLGRQSIAGVDTLMIATVGIIATAAARLDKKTTTSVSVGGGGDDDSDPGAA
jgi:DMSO/TMAO reductase YedYZ heme-binding membrane subunit